MGKDNIPKYIVVFDMDETLGHFEQLSIFWMTLVNYLNKKSIKIKKELLFEIIDNHFNKILRPKIIDILKYLQLQKKNNICDKIIIFTNNTSRKWSNLISDYFSYKLQEPIFDQVIIAFASKGKILEPDRSQYDKTYTDLLRCTKLNDDTKVCFLDDISHPEMEHQNVMYLKIKPYQYSYDLDKISQDFYKNHKDIIKNRQEYINFMKKNMEEYNYKLIFKSNLEQKVDSIISKRLRHLLEEFLENKKKLVYTL